MTILIIQVILNLLTIVVLALTMRSVYKTQQRQKRIEDIIHNMRKGSRQWPLHDNKITGWQ